MARLTIDRLRCRHLEPVSLTVRGGECIGISGSSGSGKSSLLRAVADMEPHGGTALLDGVPAGRIPAHEWRFRVRLLPAESAWWFDTVGAHFSDPGVPGHAVLGFEADIGTWPVTRLSSGERQRLAILRVLENDPQVLLLDEPTANLDGENTDRVEQLIRRFQTEHGVPVLWVGHDPAQLERVAGRRFRLIQGRLEAA